ncbi:energy-coupling factor ABC transporter substrate-binding protein [Blastococcus sp. TBT05-19]|uniref:energy-coupling factor ABC transporter substrate-binding protein n=1 Tax=Blastococcus sp. TBT05-19 TaxID=2250581 RepID=UPI000DE870D2|nr:energy-coupling factor ABC transporter substrate-binding protein [Blastococcus sp. TBT05-19]RBY90349.1 energy-coupling factor ABC transporter substrate-binding protein [Blastococcus sp. TBT05-19]
MSRRTLVTGLLVLAVIALFAVPLLVDGGTSEYGGTDAAVTEQLEADGYTPWFDSLFSPAGEVESGLFALQAALGAGVLGYVLGRLHGRRRAAASAPGRDPR